MSDIDNTGETDKENVKNTVNYDESRTKPEEEGEKAQPAEEKSRRRKKEILNYIIIMAVAAGAAFFLMFVVFKNAIVPTGSMKDTINENDRLIGLRLAYVASEPKRGDIVIFKYPDDESTLFVKRVIGLPGETVSFKDGDVYIDGVLLEEDYTKEEHSTQAIKESEYTVPENSYFVLGDNRNNSKDARWWNNTYVTKDKIEAKVLFRWWDGEKGKIGFSGL